MKVIEPDYINTFSEKFHLESKNHRDFIFEMADSLKKFKLEIRGLGAELYHHIIYICVLGNKINHITHWKKEITKFCRPVFDTELKKNCSNINRGKYVKSEMMSHYMGINFEDYDINQFDYALKCEINSGEQMLRNPELKQMWQYIKKEIEIIEDVRKHLDGVPEKCLDTIRSFYDDFCEAASKRDFTILENAINKLQPVI